MAMTRRENCLAVMNIDNPEWVVYHISYTPDLDMRVRENLKVADSVYQHAFPGAGIAHHINHQRKSVIFQNTMKIWNCQKALI